MDDTERNAPTALVTGASRGIGRATAIALADAGYDVAVAARTMTDGERRLESDPSVLVPGGLDSTVAEIEARGRRGVPIHLDLLDRASVDAAVATAIAELGKLDVLVNNAIYQGPGAMVEILDLTDHHLTPMFEANVFAQLRLVQHVLPSMIANRGGTIVNMISGTARTDPPARIGEGGWGVAYAMTKAAVERLAPLIRNEHGEDGVLAFSVEPGFVVNERMVAAGRDKIYKKHNLGAPPSVIGAAIAWLVTDPDASELSGQIVYAQREAARRGLVDGWPPPKPVRGAES